MSSWTRITERTTDSSWLLSGFLSASTMLTEAYYKPHAPLHRLTSANTIHHHGIGGGTLILYTPCSRPHNPTVFLMGFLAHLEILWQLPAGCLKSSHRVELLATSPTRCPSSSWAKRLLPAPLLTTALLAHYLSPSHYINVCLISKRNKVPIWIPTGKLARKGGTWLWKTTKGRKTYSFCKKEKKKKERSSLIQTRETPSLENQCWMYRCFPKQGVMGMIEMPNMQIIFLLFILYFPTRAAIVFTLIGHQPLLWLTSLAPTGESRSSQQGWTLEVFPPTEEYFYSFWAGISSKKEPKELLKLPVRLLCNIKLIFTYLTCQLCNLVKPSFEMKPCKNNLHKPMILEEITKGLKETTYN